MPSSLHETLTEMWRRRPALAAELLTEGLGLRLPSHEQIGLQPGEFTDIAPTEFRADAVVTLGAGDATVAAIVAEVQLGRDPRKRWSWPVYLSTLRARLRCPAILLVICVDPATARWCAKPIDLGHPNWTLVPLVIGPERFPLVTDADAATESPALAVLSAMAHATHPERDKVLDALTSALASIDPELATLYSDVVFAALPAAARRYLEGIMTRTREYQSEFVRRYVFQGRAEGRVEGEAAAVFAVLEARGIDVTDEARARIMASTDLDQVDGWVRRAATADSIDDLFD